MANSIRLGGGGSGGSATLITKSITQNGTYSAQDDSADGYSEVTVDVAGGGEVVTQFRYIKWQITANGGQSYMQMSEFGFKDSNGNIMTLPSGYSASSSLPTVSSAEGVDALFDGSTDTKMTMAFPSGSVEDIVLDFGSGNSIDITEYPYYYWCSGADDSQYVGRNPQSWKIYGANMSDFSDGVLLDEVAYITQTRVNKATIYQGLMVSPVQEGGSVEFKNYLKFNGEGIILPWTINSDYKFEVTFYDTTYYNDRAVIANDNGPAYFHFTEYSNRYYYQTSYNSESSFGSWSAGEHTIIYNDENGEISFDGTVVGNSNIPDNNSVHYQIGGRGSRTSVQAYYGYIKDCKIYSKSTGTLLYHLRPAEVLGLSCLYEEVTGKLFSNATVEAVDTIT